MAPRILIQGAGIAGLTLATALRHRGATPLVVEQAPALRAAGAGLVLASNAQRALRSIGIAPRGRPFDAFRLADSQGRPLGVLPTLPGERASLAVHRADLARALSNGVPAVRWGETVTGWDGQTATLTSGDEIDPSWWVGADGAHSTTRARIQDALGLHAAGYRCWRSVVPLDLGDDATPIELWGHGQRAGLVPLLDGRLYVYLCDAVDHPEDDLATAFVGFPEAVREAIRRASQWHVDTIAEHRDHRWVDGRIVLLGDAAHAMTPNLGQGAAMALEDAVTLAPALLSGPDAVATWARDRSRRVRFVATRARRLGEVGQWRAGWACRLRDAMLRWVPARAQQGTARRLAAFRPPRLA